MFVLFVIRYINKYINMLITKKLTSIKNYFLFPHILHYNICYGTEDGHLRELMHWSTISLPKDACQIRAPPLRRKFRVSTLYFASFGPLSSRAGPKTVRGPNIDTALTRCTKGSLDGHPSISVAAQPGAPLADSMDWKASAKVWIIPGLICKLNRWRGCRARSFLGPGAQNGGTSGWAFEEPRTFGGGGDDLILQEAGRLQNFS